MFNRVGGLKEEVPAGWTGRARAAIDEVRRGLPELDELIRTDETFLAAHRRGRRADRGRRRRLRRVRTGRAGPAGSTSTCAATSPTSPTGS